MFSSLPKRKRHVALTAAAAAAIVVAASAVAWTLRAPPDTYRPGEEIDGLTDDLSRTLPDDHPRVMFTVANDEAGITFRHFSGRRTSRLPEDMGSGAAWGDYNDDGWPDLYVVNIASLSDRPGDDTLHNVLYRNNRDGTFTDVSTEAGVDLRHIGMGAAWGDYDNDGRPDLLVTSFGSITLFRNAGDGAFVDVSKKTGVSDQPGFWGGVAWGDYDRDGFLDFYVAGYVQHDSTVAGHSQQYDVETPASLNPSSFEPERNLLFRNNGDGTFEEVALRAGVQNADGRSLTAAWVDLDEDGWIDLYVANDVSDNALFRNLGDGTFEDVSHQALVADYRGAMGIAAGDWDGDTDLDLFVTHWIAQENAFYQNMRSERFRRTGRAGILQFMDVADRFGLGQIALDYIGWGTSFLDYDNDSRLDLFVVNGSTFQQPDDPTRLVPMRDQLFWNRSSEEGFFDVSSIAGPYFSDALVGRGAAFADYDNDGDVDAFIVNHGGPGVLLRNDGGHQNSWLAVALTGTTSNRSAIGSTIRLVAAGRTHVRQVGAQASYLSQNSLTQHFGLGSAQTVDTLEINWPSASSVVHTNLPVDRLLRFVEGEGGPL